MNNMRECYEIIDGGGNVNNRNKNIKKRIRYIDDDGVWIDNVNSSEERMVKNMDNDRGFEKYIDKLDRDQVELKKDMVESEKRVESHIRESEKRIDEKIGRIENLITNQSQYFDNMNTKMDALKDTVNDKLDSYHKFLWGITITILAGVVAIAVTVALAVQ